MAEETQKVNNTKLLLVSIVLGLVVMVVYNVHIQQVRSAAKGDKVSVLRARRDIQVGQQIERKDLEITEIPRNVLEAVGSPVKEVDFRSVAERRVFKPIAKDQYLLWSHLSPVGGGAPSRDWDVGKRVKTLEFDPRVSPGRLLRPGDYVDVLGVLKAPTDKEATTYVILPAVKVAGIAGEQLREGQSISLAGRRNDQGPTRYRTIQILVDPEVSKQLNNVMTWVDGSLQLDVRPATESLPPDAGKIPKPLRDLPARTYTGRGGDFGSDGFN
ncbi:MAG: Flp pilus assembly protein CpaB [Phycisphaerae bacterium]